MAFTLPTFNLVCGIYSGPFHSRIVRLPVQVCNLAFGRRVQQSSNIDPFQLLAYVQPTLLLPPLTDVRDNSGTFRADVIECPSGTGRWYQVIGVDDIGKGFANEHRAAVLQKIYDSCDGTGTFPGLFWPEPIP